MKQFFKKIWDAIVAFFKKIINFFAMIPGVCLLYCILGMLITAVFALPLAGAIEWPMVPTIALGVLVLAVGKIAFNKKPDWELVIYYLIGAVLIQILCWI